MVFVKTIAIYGNKGGLSNVLVFKLQKYITFSLAIFAIRKKIAFDSTNFVKDFCNSIVQLGLFFWRNNRQVINYDNILYSNSFIRLLINDVEQEIYKSIYNCLKTTQNLTNLHHQYCLRNLQRLKNWVLHHLFVLI